MCLLGTVVIQVCTIVWNCLFFTLVFYLDYDMAFAANMREMGIFMFGVNENYYGRLVDSDSMPENKLHPELWLAESNRADWEENYLMPEYWDDNKREGQLDEPCPDVMTFQFLTSKGNGFKTAKSASLDSSKYTLNVHFNELYHTI